MFRNGTGNIQLTKSNKIPTITHNKMQNPIKIKCIHSVFLFYSLISAMFYVWLPSFKCPKHMHRLVFLQIPFPVLCNTILPPELHESFIVLASLNI